MAKPSVLSVSLVADPRRPVRVGTLTRNADGNVAFVVDNDYINFGPQRPILSLSWYDYRDDAGTIERLRSLADKTAHPRFLPTWFSGLLPEGSLRTLVRTEMGQGDHHDFDVLARLGADLPGAVAVIPDDPAYQQEGFRWENLHGFRAPVPDGVVKFSLAGVQLKFLASLGNERLTVPGRGADGRYIVKVPVEQYPALPEAEYTAMQLAAAAGVQTANVRLIHRDAINGIPAQFLEAGENVLVVERFDRAVDHKRIHMEDLAQVFNADGDRKYTMSSLAGVMNAFRRLSADGPGDVVEAMRRIAVDIMVGNGDNHLKNWSFLFRDGVQPIMSPAYDIVPTRAYDRDETLALPFSQQTKGAARIGLARFMRAADWLKVDLRYAEGELRKTVELACDVWPKMLNDLPASENVRKSILGYMYDNELVGDVHPKMHVVKQPEADDVPPRI